MLLKSKIEPSNKQVRNVPVLGTTYAFTNDGKGNYVAEVTDERHQDILLNSNLFVLDVAGMKAAAKAEALNQVRTEQKAEAKPKNKAAPADAPAPESTGTDTPPGDKSEQQGEGQ